MTDNTKRDSFQYKIFQRSFGRPFTDRTRVQWDYRDKNGELHSGVAKTVGQAINAAKRFGYKGGESWLSQQSKS